MSKQKIAIWLDKPVYQQLKQCAIQRSAPGLSVSMSGVAAQMLAQALLEDSERSLDSLLGVRLENLLRSLVQGQYSGIRRLLARAAIEANATRRLLAMHIEDTRGAEYAKELTSASYLAALESIRKTSSDLEATLAVMVENHSG